jgi:dolichol-phosphate mannosyltransferase
MGSRYLFIVAYMWLEKYFSRGDYLKSDAAAPTSSKHASEPVSLPRR